jgi:hypothetical protein
MQRRAGALAQTACAIAVGLGGAAAGAVVAVAPVVADVRVEKPNALSARLAAVIAGALGRPARAISEPVSLGRAHTLAGSAKQLVFVRAELTRGEFRVTADVYPVVAGFWTRVRQPNPSPTAHAFASGRVDAELRTFLPAIPLIATRIDKAKGADRNANALACGDVDGDGALEIVVASRWRIALCRIRAGRVVALASKAWSDLSPVAANPLREPIGGITIHPSRFIDVGLSDRADAVRLDPELRVTNKLGRRIPWPAGGCSTLGSLALQGGLEPCAPSDAREMSFYLAQPTDTIASDRVVQTDGSVRSYFAARSASDASLLLADDVGRSLRTSAVGAQLALGDLDLDGQPEILSSENTLDPRADSLLVRTWHTGGPLTERFRTPIPNGVGALAVCPAGSGGLRSIVVATGDELWLVR